ncbi:acetyl-CoA synthetase-like protein [Cantharellus anzutake]|uniref:acetyl-CoA synthetase-like protein n=1 Tax=Cantharellus anzutake TaxID=1750568 RepID=UPI00190392FB|nr:acetyl-CoA synthetase-like protein [Cantharellus anzutake]KAF8334058.1 acetyl-CoA synthetase-like protein [Cantharellus anzutake]
MAVEVSRLLDYNNSTLLLGAAVVLLYAVRSYLQPVPLAHPLLLGRQSDVGKVRKVGETAVYRNYGVGHGAALPARPRKEVNLAHDVLHSDSTREQYLWGTKITNEKLRLRIQALGNGLVRTVGLAPNKSSAIILLDDSFVNVPEWLFIDLTLSTFGMTSITLTQLKLLGSVLSRGVPDVIFTDSSLLELILEQVAEEGNHFPIVVVGKDAASKVEAGRNLGFNVVTLDEVERSGKGGENTTIDKIKPADIFSTAYHGVTKETPTGVHITHMNLTSGPTAIRQFFTLTSPLSPASTVLSAFPLATPFGRAIAYTALLEGSNFATLASTSLLQSAKATIRPTLDEIVRAASSGIPRPTHLFILPDHLDTLRSSIIAHASSSFYSGWAWGRKLVDLAGGALAENTFFDRIGGLNQARRATLGYSKTEPWLNAVVAAGGPCDESQFPSARIALSIPLINAHIEYISTAPIFASHPFDLQHFPPSVAESYAHVGPPGPNIEVKLVAVSDDSQVDETKGDPRGKVFYRGPSLCEPIPPLASGPVGEQWVDSGRIAVIHSNGTFNILE